MKRIWHLGVCAALVMGLGLSGCGKSPVEGQTETTPNQPAKVNTPSPTAGEDLSTPEKTFEKFKALAIAKDYQKSCNYMTPDAQRTTAGVYVMFGIEMQSEITEQEADGSKLTDQEKNFIAAINTLYQKHKLLGNESAKTEIQLTGSTASGREAQIRELVKPLDDPKAFIADFIQTMSQYGAQKDPRLMEEDAHLENLKINKDKTFATADFVQTRSGKERRSPVEFLMYDGQWKLSKVPDLFH